MKLFRRENSRQDDNQKKIIRCRSLPSAYHYRFAVALCAIHYLCLVAMVTTAVMLILYPDHGASSLLIAAFAASIGTWFLALLKRRTTVCPLCKGTPLIESGALFHARARRLFPLRHGITAILSILFLQRFRCMYCGTDYDLLKEPTLQRRRPKSKRRFPFFTPKD